MTSDGTAGQASPINDPLTGNLGDRARGLPRTRHRFWIDPRMSFLEARWVRGGQGIGYAPHSHAAVSIGLVLTGQTLYANGGTIHAIGAGTVVMMNPGAVHACNPQPGTPWSYVMLYLDTAWLAGLMGFLSELVAKEEASVLFSSALTTDQHSARLLLRVFSLLEDDTVDPAEKRRRIPTLILRLMMTLQRAGVMTRAATPGAARRDRAPVAGQGVARAAAFLHQHWDETVPLDALSSQVAVSPSHLIRRFKAVYGLTPHAYLNNCRIQKAKQVLRQGTPIAETAVTCGFVDQAHFQRVFKRLTAATPGDYARAVKATELPRSRRGARQVSG